MPRGRVVRPIRWYVLELDEWGTVPRNGQPGVFFWRPVLTVKRIEDGEWRDASEDLLPGYVLVGSRLGWRHIEREVGVALLRAGPVPVPLGEDELDRVRERESLYICREPDFRPGQEVRVRPTAWSSYAGLTGMFRKSVRVTGGKYAYVSLDLYGEGEITVHLPIDHLEAV